MIASGVKTSTSCYRRARSLDTLGQRPDFWARPQNPVSARERRGWRGHVAGSAFFQQRGRLHTNPYFLKLFEKRAKYVLKPSLEYLKYVLKPSLEYIKY